MSSLRINPTSFKKHQIDFLHQHKKRRRIVLVFLKVILGLFVLLVVTISLFSWKVISTGQDIFVPETNEKISFLGFVKRLILSEDRETPVITKERLNILLLGMGGEGHEGALLTDTIMVVSIKPDSGDVAMISIPRDLYISLDGKVYQKINSLHAYGEVRKSGLGIDLVSQAVEKITGLPVDYYLRLDFVGFEKIIDTLGGVDVYVEQSFYDPQYPGPNYGYQTVSFKKGENHMNGDQALKYVRSRHGIVLDGQGSESSDFARAKRQQKVLAATKDKAFSLKTILNPKKLSDILTVLGGHIKTNIKPEEIFPMIEMAYNLNIQNVAHAVIDDKESGLLYAKITRQGAYVLLPKDKDFSSVHEFCQNVFLRQDIQKENAKIEILNGTKISGLATKTQEELKKSNFNIVSVDDAEEQDFEKTVIYDFTSSKPATVKALREKFNANVCKYAKKFSNQDVDLVLVLGKERGQLAHAN